MEIEFHGKRALVTGGANGIGKTIAEKLVRCGAKVFVLDKNSEDLTTLKGETPEIETVHVDLRLVKESEEAIRKCLPIDLLVNNAGIITRKSMLEVRPEDIDMIFEVNYKASFLTSQIVIKDLIERKCEGSIVNVGSSHSIIVQSTFATYSNSKAALQNMTVSLALECGPHKIRVNCVNAYGVDTPLTRGLGLDLDNPLVRSHYKKKVPLQSVVMKEDIANAVLFLLSDKASRITGVNIPVDSGFSITSHM